MSRNWWTALFFELCGNLGFISVVFMGCADGCLEMCAALGLLWQYPMSLFCKGTLELNHGSNKVTYSEYSFLVLWPHKTKTNFGDSYVQFVYVGFRAFALHDKRFGIREISPCKTQLGRELVFVPKLLETSINNATRLSIFPLSRGINSLGGFASVWKAD